MLRGPPRPKSPSPAPRELKTAAEDALAALEAAHGRELDALEERALSALLALYGDLQEELVTRLASAVENGRDFTAQHLAAISAQVGSAIEPWAQASGDAMAEQVAQAVPVGARQVAREVLRAEELTDPAGEVVARLRDWAPQIPVGTVAELAQAQSIIVRRTASEVQERVGQALAKAVALGEGMDAAARRLREVVGEESWRLRRIARTEINNAASLGHEASIVQAANRFPGLGLQKRWSAARDARTSPTCRSLDGQVRETEQAFEGQGWSGQRPPAHPNCRSRVVPWVDRWAREALSSIPRTFEETRSLVQEVLADPSRRLGPEDVRDIGQAVQTMRFNPRRVKLPASSRGLHFGQDFGDEPVSDLVAHAIKRQREQGHRWSSSLASPEAYLQDLRAVGAHPGLQVWTSVRRDGRTQLLLAQPPDEGLEFATILVIEPPFDHINTGFSNTSVEAGLSGLGTDLIWRG